MTHLKHLLVAMFLLLLGSPAFAATYYIDITLGDDTRTSKQAQSKATPWKHLRCMASATSNALAYTPVAGDVFVLKGGETWGNTNFPCNWNWSGTAARRITITVDDTWYTGSSWSRPIWDAEDTAIIGAKNIFLWFNFSARQYVTFSNIEMKRLHWDGIPAFGTCGYVIGAGASYITLDQVYIHAWSHGSATSGTTDSCHIIYGDASLPHMIGSIIQNSIIDGSDSTGGGDSGKLYIWPSYINNVIKYTSQGLINKGNAIVSGNDISHCVNNFDGVSHPNFFESLGATVPHTLYFYNNVIHDGASGCEAAFFAGQNATVYAWNNVWYNLSGNPPEFDRQGPTPPNGYFWNNTIVAKATSSGYCLRSGGHKPDATPKYLSIQNNHCITTSPTPWDPALTAGTLTVSNNLLQTPTGAGHNVSQSPYVYYPTTGGDTIGAGVNLSANCTGNATLAELCYDTPYGATEGTGHTVVVGARTRIARHATDAWDIGAYQSPLRRAQ